MSRTLLVPALAPVALLVALLVAPGCPPATVEPPRPRALLILPPDSPDLDPLLGSGRTRLEEPWRRLVVEAGHDVLPRALAEALDDRGVSAIGLTGSDLAAYVTSDPDRIVERLGHRALAQAHQADHLLRLRYDGEIRRGGGVVDWFGGLVSITYPSDTTWYELEVRAELIDPRDESVVRRLDLRAASHTELIGLLGNKTNRDYMIELARDVADRLAAAIAD